MSAVHVLVAMASCHKVTALPPQHQPNPPIWPASVKIYSPSSPIEQMRAELQESWNSNGYQPPTGEAQGRFSVRRYAFMFMPGEYDLDFPIGYYVQVLGLGALPGDVVFTGDQGPHVPCNLQKPGPGQLTTFWRGAERFRREGSMDWLVSQACVLRDVHITGDLVLQKDGAYASGGYLGNSIVEGEVVGGGQQQWFSRNARIGSWSGVGWNAVFVGVTSDNSQPDLNRSTCGSMQDGGQRVVVEKAPLVAEKPFISVDPQDSTKFNLNVPWHQYNRSGPDWQRGRVYGFESVYVTQPTDTAAEINGKLLEGYHVVMSPGVYILDSPLRIFHDYQVLLCLGLSTLLSMEGHAAVTVDGGLQGVRIAGCILEAGQRKTDTLMQWGNGTKTNPAEFRAPSFMHDLFARVGGPGFGGNIGNTATADVMVRISADDVIGDDLWLWRADHYEHGTTLAHTVPKIGLTRLGELPCDHGLVVTGNRVKMYALAVEHAQKDQVRWSGEDGETYFFQCEIPYGVNTEYAQKGYVAYRVLDGVQRHDAWGIGAYSYFRDFPVWMPTAFRVPDALVRQIRQPFVIKLWAHSGINTTINGIGPGVGLQGQKFDRSWMNNDCVAPSNSSEQPRTGPLLL